MFLEFTRKLNNLKVITILDTNDYEFCVIYDTPKEKAEIRALSKFKDESYYTISKYDGKDEEYVLNVVRYISRHKDKKIKMTIEEIEDKVKCNII